MRQYPNRQWILLNKSVKQTVRGSILISDALESLHAAFHLDLRTVGCQVQNYYRCIACECCKNGDFELVQSLESELFDLNSGKFFPSLLHSALLCSILGNTIIHILIIRIWKNMRPSCICCLESLTYS